MLKNCPSSILYHLIDLRACMCRVLVANFAEQSVQTTLVKLNTSRLTRERIDKDKVGSRTKEGNDGRKRGGSKT